MIIYLIVTLWAYPFGGGEAFLHDTMKWAHSRGMRVFWISFARAGPESSTHAQFQVHAHEFGTLIDVPGDMTASSLALWLRLLKPDIVHHQGHCRSEVVAACCAHGVPIMSGVHFWNGVVNLNGPTGNHQIMSHIAQHKPCKEFLPLTANRNVVLYACSEFVQSAVQQITGHKIDNIIYPASDDSNRIKMSYKDRLKRRRAMHVTLINIVSDKGGDILAQLAQKLPQIPFLGIQTAEGANTHQLSSPSSIEPCTNQVWSIYGRTRILLVPSLVDETFCRVANEGLMHQLPMITTGNGFIAQMLGDAAIYLPGDDVEAWAATIEALYHDEARLWNLSQKAAKRYKHFSVGVAQPQFNRVCDETLAKKFYNIMFFVPWCDQGLGIQAKYYVEALRRTPFNVCIFSYCPYACISGVETARALQANAAEWENSATVFYSKWHREAVPDSEIIEFVRRHHIGVCVIPETCWSRVFEIAELLQSMHVKCHAIPNIEIVRKDEVYRHKVFDKILCNNELCAAHFQRWGFDNTTTIGFALPSMPSIPVVAQPKQPTKKKNKVPPPKTEELKFLFMGGFNAQSRKQMNEVMQAFVEAAETWPTISLTVCFQKRQPGMVLLSHPRIHVIDKHMNNAEVKALLQSHQVFIQVSKHEGLGLGFFEALSAQLPVLTLDTAPHNEIIVDGVNGWTIPCFFRDEAVLENMDGVIQPAFFEIQALCDKMCYIANSYVPSIHARIREQNEQNAQEFNRRFSAALGIVAQPT